MNIEKTKEKVQPFSNVPFHPNKDFVERPGASRWLHEEWPQLGQRVALIGLGGVG